MYPALKLLPWAAPSLCAGPESGNIMLFPEWPNKDDKLRLKRHYWFIAELWRSEGPPSGAPYSYRKEKKTHELIFSWLSWLAVLLVRAYARRTVTTTMTMESRKMAAILHLKGWQKHTTLIYGRSRENFPTLNFFWDFYHNEMMS